MEGQWDNTISSLQDILNANEALALDTDWNETTISQLSKAELEELRTKVVSHRENVDKSRRILNTAIENANVLFKQKSQSAKGPAAKTSGKSKQKKGKRYVHNVWYNAGAYILTDCSYYQSVYNSSDPVIPGSEVAYKLRQRGLESEWIQCEVTRIVTEIKFEVRDPEPDENNNPGQTYKATWKDIILLPLRSEAPNLINYPYGTKVLARYPETTTFYPAEVIGTKRDGRCRLRFEGEEEEGKETEVERRLVLPYPV